MSKLMNRSMPARAATVLRADDAADGAAEERLGGKPPGGVQGQRAAVGAHQGERARSACPRAACQPVQVAADHRHQPRIQDRGREPLILAAFPRDFGCGGDGDARAWRRSSSALARCSSRIVQVGC